MLINNANSFDHSILVFEKKINFNRRLENLSVSKMIQHARISTIKGKFFNKKPWKHIFQYFSSITSSLLAYLELQVQREFYKLLIHPWKNLSIHRIIYFWIRMTLAPQHHHPHPENQIALASAAPGLRSPPCIHKPIIIRISKPYGSCTPFAICILITEHTWSLTFLLPFHGIVPSTAMISNGTETANTPRMERIFALMVFLLYTGMIKLNFS